MKYVYLRQKFKLTPFTQKTLLLMSIGVFCFLLTFWIPSLIHPLIAIFMRSTIFGLMYLFLILHFKISEDFEALFMKWKNKFLLKK